MERNFTAELRSFITTLDKPAVPASTEEEKPKARRYNIHRRSLPPGVDIKVLFGIFSKQLAEDIIENATDYSGVRLFKSVVTDKGVIFYEPVPMDATERERSPFHNEGPITK